MGPCHKLNLRICTVNNSLVYSGLSMVQKYLAQEGFDYNHPLQRYGTVWFDVHV